MIPFLFCVITLYVTATDPAVTVAVEEPAANWYDDQVCTWTPPVTAVADDPATTTTDETVEAVDGFCSYAVPAEYASSCSADMQLCLAHNAETEVYMTTTADASVTDNPCSQATDAHCTWLPFDSAIVVATSTLIGVGENAFGLGSGMCVANNFQLCDLMDCMHYNLIPQGICGVKNVQIDCENPTYLPTFMGTLDAIALETLMPSELNFGGNYMSLTQTFADCYDWTTPAATDDVPEPVSVKGDRKANYPGPAWIVCDPMQDDLPDLSITDADDKEVKHPCVGVTNENVWCRGSESCSGLLMKGDAICQGRDSCFDSKFKPKKTDSIIQCSGRTACDRARGWLRNSVDTGYEEHFVYYCKDNSEACTEATFSDNTQCSSDEACVKATIDAALVECDYPNGNNFVCGQAIITADEISCRSTKACRRAEMKVAETLDCVEMDSCYDSKIRLKGDAQLDCMEDRSCLEAEVRYVLGVFNGNHSMLCPEANSCKDATIAVETVCSVNNSCLGATIKADTMCVEADSCKQTAWTRGTICCGDGCPYANLKVGDDGKQGIGCLITGLEDDKTYGKCVRCGKETLVGWMTATKTNMVVTLVVVILILLIFFGVVGFLVKKFVCKPKDDASTTVVE